LAYQLAESQFLPQGVNRVILATDGDFNVGITSEGELVRLIRRQAESGVFLTVLGYGMGNYKDSTLEKLADRGNGNYAYIDSPREARKVLAEQLDATLVTIAKDVKIQVEFNPARVQAYRLIGYENRLLENQDFRDDQRDAGDIGAGHRVTAFYELIPPGVAADVPAAPPLRYRHRGQLTSAATLIGETATIRLRYKAPDGHASRELSFTVSDRCRSWGEASADFRFGATVAAFGMVLAESEYCRGFSLEAVADLARACVPKHAAPIRQEFVTLCDRAAALAGPHLATD
jgi:Ca-activated chloride channel family protein